MLDTYGSGSATCPRAPRHEDNLHDTYRSSSCDITVFVWLCLICNERKVLLTGWWLVLIWYKRKILLVGWLTIKVNRVKLIVI